MGSDTIVCEILNYNSASITKKLADKIKNYSAVDCVLIIDNNSTDDSFSQLVNEYKNEKKVIVKSSGRNGGYGYGNNFGVKYAYKYLNASYVVIMNPDVMFDNSLLVALYKCMKKRNAAVVAGTQIVNGKKVGNSAWMIPTPYQWVIKEVRGRPKKFINHIYYPRKFFNKPVSEVECVNGAMLMVDAEKFLEIGGYDENMFLFGEESTLGAKLKQKGYKSYLLNNKYYHHMHSASINKSIPNQIHVLRLLHKSKVYFLKNYTTTSPFTLLIVKFLLGSLTTHHYVKSNIKKRFLKNYKERSL